MGRNRRIAIAGGGDIGLRSANMLHDRGHDVILVERDHERCEQLTDAFLGTVIEGDARRPNVLRQADPGRCDTVAALTGDPPTNAGICLTADRLSDVHTVLRVTGEEEIVEYADTADRLLQPDDAAARAVTNELVGASVRSIEAITEDLHLLEIEVAAAAPAAGQQLADVKLPSGSLVVAGTDGGLSGPDTILEAGQRYLVAVTAADEQQVLNLLRG